MRLTSDIAAPAFMRLPSSTIPTNSLMFIINITRCFYFDKDKKKANDKWPMTKVFFEHNFGGWTNNFTPKTLVISLLSLVISLGVPAKPSGFPLYLCSLSFYLAQKSRSPQSEVWSPSLAKDAAPIPNALGDGNGVLIHRTVSGQSTTNSQSKKTWRLGDSVSWRLFKKKGAPR